MSIGGFIADPTVKPLSQDVQDSKLRGIVLYFGGKTLKVEARIENSSKDAFKELVSYFADDKVRFAVFKIRGKNSDGRDITKAVLIEWFGPNTSLRDKMSYSNYLDCVRKELKNVDQKCEGKNDVTRPWLLNVIKHHNPVSMDGRAVKIAADGEYSYI